MHKGKPPKGITRIEIPARNTFGWMVRILRGTQHPHEFFADKRFGGIKKAEQAALAFYKELKSSLPPPLTSIKDRMTKRNKSGKVGVHIGINSDRRHTKEYAYWFWTAQWIDKEGKRKTKTFSWNRYGDELAHELACIARDNETQEISEIKAIYKRLKNKELQI